MPVTFLPSRDAELLNWSATFSALITSTPTAFGLVAAQASAYGALHLAFGNALALATAEATRTKATVKSKDVARANLRASASNLSKIIQGTPSVTDAQKITLGLNVRAIPQNIPVPSSAPGIEIVSVVGRVIRIRLYDTASSTKRGKPVGVSAATVFSCVSNVDPTSPSEFRFEGSTTRATADVLMPESVAPGSKVYLTAMWTNPRMQSGPACTPVSTHTQFGGGMQMAA